jgi:hypothetical protein
MPNDGDRNPRLGNTSEAASGRFVRWFAQDAAEQPLSPIVSALLALAEQLTPADRVTLARLLVGNDRVGEHVD